MIIEQCNDSYKQASIEVMGSNPPGPFLRFWVTMSFSAPARTVSFPALAFM
jgi:hypothetical protein